MSKQVKSGGHLDNLGGIQVAYDEFRWAYGGGRMDRQVESGGQADEGAPYREHFEGFSVTSQQLTSVPMNYNQIIYHNYFQLICPLSLSWLMSFLNFDHMLKGVFSSPTTEVCLKESRRECVPGASG